MVPIGPVPPNPVGVREPIVMRFEDVKLEIGNGAEVGKPCEELKLLVSIGEATLIGVPGVPLDPEAEVLFAVGKGAAVDRACVGGYNPV